MTYLAAFALGLLAGVFIGVFIAAVAARSTPDYPDSSGDYLGG